LLFFSLQLKFKIKSAITYKSNPSLLKISKYFEMGKLNPSTIGMNNEQFVKSLKKHCLRFLNDFRNCVLDSK